MTAWGWLERGELRRALDEFDDARVRQLCRRYVDHVGTSSATDPPEDGLQVMVWLQRKRRNGEVRQVAEALLGRNPRWPTVVHRYALALLDEESPAAAEALLATIASDPVSADAEVQGALGRLHKQRYLTPGLVPESRRPAELRAAIEVYRTSYEQDPSARFYQGINAAALLCRAAADGIDALPDATGVAAGIAERILIEIEAMPEPPMWACASAAEACVALHRYADASAWLFQYVSSDADAFEFASTLRQFEQVWRLDATSSPGREVLPLLRGRLMQASGGACSLAPGEYTAESLDRIENVERDLRQVTPPQYERVLGYDRFKTLNWWRRGLDKCRSVAMVQDEDGDGHGTAFVIAGRQIRDDWPDRVLLTNSHVVPEALPAYRAWAGFYGINNDPDGAAHVVRVGKILWQSPKQEYDACILDMADPLSPEATALPLQDVFPTLGPDHQVRAYVIGHPLGQPQIRLSLHDTLVLDVDERVAHYRSPTMNGSSGSPVFDDAWHLIALHHGWVGGGSDGTGVEANEGIRLDRIMSAARLA